MRLQAYKVLTFDCYGTLIDWESGIIHGLRLLLAKLSSPPSRDDVLRLHARCESSQQAKTPTMRYRELLATVYAQIAAELQVAASADECAAYGDSVGQWRPFADSVDALRYLKRHYALVVLSNVDEASWARSAQKLGVAFDAVFTAETVGAYKPADANFELMIARLANLGFAARDILHTAESVFHDHIPAGKHGLDCCHIYRRHNQPGFGATMTPTATPQVAFRFNSMAELVAAHRRELAQ